MPNLTEMDTPRETMDKAIPKKKGLQKKHIGYIAIGIAIVVLVYMAFFADRTSTYKVEKDKLIIETVSQDQFNDYITVPGTVEPITIVYLDAQEGGRVEEKVIEEGTMVKKGDIILKLSNPDLHLNILDSEAQLAEKENFLRNTQINMEQQRLQVKRELVTLKYDIERKERNYQQNVILMKDNLISKEEFIRSKEDVDMARQSRELYLERQRQDSVFYSININTMITNLDNMRKNLQLVRERAENLNVRAPVDGQLGLLTPEIGQNIQRGANMGQINVLTSYKVTAQIDEHYIDRVRTQLTATLDRQGKEYNLIVKRVYPEVRNGTFEIDMIFRDSMPDNIRTGQTYYTSLQLGQPKVSVLVPIGGFFQETGGQWIFVLDPTESFAYRRNISIGRKNPRFYEVLDGLTPGEKVIVSGYETFGKNEKLILKKSK
jgi:HlyD family secretion protein